MTSDAFWTVGTLVMEGRRLRVIKARAKRAPDIKPAHPVGTKIQTTDGQMIITDDAVR